MRIFSFDLKKHMNIKVQIQVFFFLNNVIFLRLKRSQSTTFNLDDNLLEGEFKRGGVRATAGPRLGWSRDLQRVNK